MQPPSEFSNYPRGGFNSGPRRPPGIYFEFIGEAFNLIKAKMGVWLLAGLIGALMLGLGYAINFFMQMVGMGPDFNPNAPTMEQLPKYFAISLIGNIILTSVQYGVTAGFAFMAIEQSNGVEIQVGDMFKGFQNIFSLLISAFLVSIMVGLGLCLCIVPGIYLSGLTALVIPIAAFQRLGPIDAIAESMRVLKPFAWAMFGLYLVASIVSVLGLLACGVGILFTYPVIGIVVGLTYDTFYPRNGDRPISDAYYPRG